MLIHPFLAMTAVEIRNCSSFHGKMAWMACHFSPYGTGLTNLPASLPPDSLLILNDRTPICGHDPDQIGQQLSETIETHHCQGLLLDFQRPDCVQTQELAKHLISTLTCPIGISELYAKDLNCAVFLPPVPPSMTLTEHVSPWIDRDIWLELALEGECILVTEHGAETTPLPYPDLRMQGFDDKTMHCHYHIAMEDGGAKFTLWRTWDDLNALTQEAELLGIDCYVGLYQELYSWYTSI